MIAWVSGLQNSKLKLWQNSNNDKTKKNQIVTKLKKSNCEILKKSNCENSKTRIVTKLKNSNCGKPQNLDCDKTKNSKGLLTSRVNGLFFGWQLCSENIFQISILPTLFTWKKYYLQFSLCKDYLTFFFTS